MRAPNFYAIANERITRVHVLYNSVCDAVERLRAGSRKREADEVVNLPRTGDVGTGSSEAASRTETRMEK